MAYPEYYNILGVKTDASPDEIKQAYICLVKKYHPDTHQGNKASEDRLKQINEAYDVLKDLAKRAEYDYFGVNEELAADCETPTPQTKPVKYPKLFAYFGESAKFHLSLRVVACKLFFISFIILYGIFLYAHRDPQEPNNLLKMLTNSSQALIKNGKEGIQTGLNSFGSSMVGRQKIVDGLFYLVRNNHVKSLKSLLKIMPAETAYFCVNAADKQNHNRTLLMEAQNPEIITLLIAAGAIVDRVDDLGETALTLAVRNGNAVAVELLLQAGADAQHKLPDGSTPLQLAVLRNDTIIMTLLQSRIRP